MKTDLEKFKELYKSVGIDLEEKVYDDDGGVYLSLKEGDNEKLTGYYYFYSHIIFDKDGKFKEQGFWE